MLGVLEVLEVLEVLVLEVLVLEVLVLEVLVLKVLVLKVLEVLVLEVLVLGVLEVLAEAEVGGLARRSRSLPAVAAGAASVWRRRERSERLAEAGS
ncbi:MAG: hypothetical protein KBA95_05010 [Acidobacteria bacterium]|nr:hypothetical protein [Acidobacteriota bacterium]